MQKIILMLGMGLFMLPRAWSQPTDKEIETFIRSKNQQVHSIQLSSKGGTLKKELEDGAWVENYYRGYTVKSKTEYPDVYYVVAGEYKYRKSGSNYSFVRSFIADTYYEGFDNPKEQEVLALVEKNWAGFFNGTASQVIGKVETISLADNPTWKWHDVNSVSLRLKLVYRVLTSSTIVERVEQLHELRLYRDDINQDFDRFISKTIDDSDARKVLAQEQHTADEVRKMLSLQDILEGKQPTTTTTTTTKTDVQTEQKPEVPVIISRPRKEAPKVGDLVIAKVEYRDYWAVGKVRSINETQTQVTLLDGAGSRCKPNEVLLFDLIVGDTVYVPGSNGGYLPVEITKIETDIVYVKTANGSTGSYYLKAIRIQ